MILRKAGKFLLYGIAAMVGVILLLMLALKLVLDRAPQYQAQIKDWVHAQTGYHIRFAHVSPAFHWYGPELYFDQLELRSKDDQRVLIRAAGGRVAADIWQLIRSGKLLAGRVELDSPSIVIARLGPSRFAVAAELELGGEHSTMQTLRFDDLPAGRLAIRHAAVTLQDWNPQLPLLAIHDVDLDMRRTDEVLSLGIRAQLPPVLGGTLSLSLNARGRGDVSAAAWGAFAGVRGMSFPGWRRLLPEYLGPLDAGSGSFELVAGGQGANLSRADLEFSATGVTTQLADGPVAHYDEMSGALALSHAANRWTLSGKRVRAARRDPESAFDVTWHASDDGLQDLSVRASYLRSDTLLPLTVFLPQKTVRERLRQIALTGEWTDTSLVLARQAIGDPWQFQVRATLRDVGFAPVGAVPGLRGLTGTLAGTESGGHVFLESDTAVFSWPTQLSQAVDLQKLAIKLYWKRTADSLLVSAPGFELKSRDAMAHGKASWEQPSDGSSPLLTLVSTIENGNVANARNYLPRALLPPPALTWLDRAFVAGHLSRADAVLQGPIKHFPFRDGSGLFLARCALDNMTLDYTAGWPALVGLSGTAEFRNEGMSAHMLTGRLGDIKLESAEAHFPDFKTGELRIRAGGRGDAAAALGYLRATPLDAMAEHAFSGVEAGGPLESNVDLFLPFKDFANRRILVHGHLDGATLNRTGSSTMASEVSGDFDVENGQVTKADIRGRVLGGPFQMQSRVARNKLAPRTQLEFRGTLSADALRTALAVPAAIAISGQTDWRAVLKMAPEPARERSLRISSTLVGFDMRLPAPLDKPIEAPLPSWLEIQWPATGGPQGRLALGSLVGGSYALESDDNGTHLAHASLGFGTGDAAAGDAQIFNLGGSVEQVDLAGWLKLIPPADPGAKPLSYYLRQAKLDVGELDYLGLAFRNVSLNLAVSDTGMRITVGGPNVGGSIILPAGNNISDPWSLQFDRLSFDVAEHDAATPSDSGDAAATTAKGFSDPRGIPSLNFHAAELIWGGRHFGDVRATLIKLDDGVSMQQLNVTGADFAVNAKGEWRGKDAGISRIEGSLTSSDVQSTLKQLGYADVIQAKAGKMDFDLNWRGPPTAEALSQVAGHVQLSLDRGQVTGLKPGAGRVLGLASIAALPRRLSLDFSDLTDRGLAFDTVRGDFDLRDGNAYTDNVLLKGAGCGNRLDRPGWLEKQDYDQTAVVTGSVGNSLSIPVASALVGGPVVGAAVLLFTQVFKQPLKGLARGYYRITGGWDNPTVERIKSAGAAAATAEAPK